MNSINIKLLHNYCTGCNACAEVCPKRCISMQKDSAGFFYPILNQSNCISCGLCSKVCPIDNTTLLPPLKAFAARNVDAESHLKSSSGGIAYVLSLYVIRRGGVVYGCAFEGEEVRHIRVDSLVEAKSLQGSKYVQSNINGIYESIKHDLALGKEVLFIGTPCQCAGLKNFIAKDSPNLYIVDLVCHGVPSQKMLYEYIDRRINIKQVSNISFRQGNKFVFTVTGKDCQFSYNLWADRYADTYYNAFIDGISYRISCYNCQYATKNRVADITIGDFWGLKDSSIFTVREGTGISLILPCTTKGVFLLSAIEQELEIIERSVDEAIMGNSQLRSPQKDSFRSRLFRCAYRFLPFDVSAGLSLSDKILRRLLSQLKRRLVHGTR